MTPEGPDALHANIIDLQWMAHDAAQARLYAATETHQ